MKKDAASDVQSQFFLSDQLHPGIALNTMTRALRIDGPLDEKRLAGAVAALSLRHRELRVRLQTTGDGAIRALEDSGSSRAPLEVSDSADDPEALERAADEARRSLSPGSPTWRALLLRHGADRHTFIFCAHRSAFDEDSFEIAASELSRLYGDSDPGVGPEGSSPPAIEGTDDDASAPDREGQPGEGGRFFAESLADAPSIHGFPLKAPRPRLLTVDAASVDMDLDAATRAALVEAAALWGLDPFAIQAAGAAYVLAHYCGQRKLSIGMPLSLRSELSGGRSVGGYTSILPLGFDAEAGSTFESLSRAFASTRDSARPFALTPFHSIARACGARTDPSANPLFQVAFESEKPFALALGVCECRALPVSSPPQQLDLFLLFTPGSLRISYARMIIADETAASLARSIRTFLSAALREPGRALSELPVIGEEDRDALVAGVNRSDEPSFFEQDLYDLVSRYCAATNRKTALSCAGKPLSYAELGKLVGRAAAALTSAGDPPGELVGICLPRSVEMVAAMLAVLRIGKAFVPLDPAFPPERLAYMIGHSRISRIVSTAALAARLASPAIEFIELDRTGEGRADAPPPARVSPDAPAYVIYTSGSTGNPKGVVVPRGALANFLSSMLRRPGIGSGDTLCAVTTLSFDIAELELLAPLCAGGTVAIATEEEARDPRRLAALLRESRATMLQATPVTWQMLCASGWAGDAALTALCGGEALSPALAQALLPRVRALWNMYGPTETTVWSTCCRITDPGAPISVGEPIGNTSVYVLDKHGRPAPPEVEGQLFVGGAGVASGYLRDPELTAKRFFPDPIKGVGRMYDTGDRARFDSRGRLYIVGRSDFQVKLRGFRIELGEIETRLSAFPGIAQVVAVVRRDDPDNPELVAYYTLRGEAAEPSVAQLRQHCGGTLPAYMVPSRFRRLDVLPLTPNGKVDRKALPKPSETREAAPKRAAESLPRSDIERALADIWRAALSQDSVGANDNFFELGGTSLSAFTVAQEIGKRFGSEFPVLKVFEYPTISALAQFLGGERESFAFIGDARKRAEARRRESPSSFDVAIIGAAGRFPGARNLEELWALLSEGRETTTFFDRKDLDPLVPERDRSDPAYVPARGVLADIDQFDGAFFGITPSEAELMDPQQRVFLEVCWEAFENAGYVGERIEGPVGVWASKGNDFYYLYNVLTRPDKLAVMGEIAAEIANEKDHIAPRVSHKLNLTGPSLSVHTACSSTLVVVENAYQALATRQVDVALAGGVDIRTPQRSGQRFEEGGIFSDDGRCRPFDAAATGTMFGEGAGAVVMKRLDDALRDGDGILAVIKGAAVNHDGGKKVSYLAPSVEGQARVIASALAIGGVDPDTVSFIEAHGTGTPIGDPIEVEALTRVFRAYTQRKGYCAIGSIKSNFGHATTAAGIAGLLKVVLALGRRKIPATLHYSAPNPRIDFDNSPFFVNPGLIDWAPSGPVRRAGVSSFGFCGTNAHVVVEEAPPARPSSPPSRPVQLFLLSARHPKALEEMARSLAASLEGASAERFADAAYTTQVGRKRFEHRRCVAAASPEGAAAALAQASGGSSLSLLSESENPPVAFMFPGQGAQYVNMGLGLYRGEEAFRDAVDHCSEALTPFLGCDLREFLFPDLADAEKASQSLNNTYYTQPAIFTISYSVATLMESWGIRPGAFIGHSIGEFVAAALGGVMELDEALRLVAARGRLMQALPPGSMLTVRLAEERVRERLPPGVDMAAVNSPRLCVVAGPTDALLGLSGALESEGVACRMLHTSHAFHSSMMDPIVDEFRKTVETVRLSPPRIPFVSTVTGDWITAEAATDPSYWARHLRSPVLFSKAVRVLLEDGQRALVECGPRRTCATLALQHRPENPGRIVAAMPDGGECDDECPSALLALGALWANGCEIDWKAFHAREVRHRVALPTYPFQRRRYWLEPGDTSSFGLGSAKAARPAPLPSEERAALAAEGAARGRDGVMTELVAILEEALGSAFESFDENARFIELGLDSLLITQLARIVRLRLGFEVTFRQLSETYSTPRALADAVRASRKDSGAEAPPQQATAGPSSPAAPKPVAAAGARLGRDERGRPAWFVPDPARPGKYVKAESHE
jgi:amino acid adenylation domain-containing protein